MKKLDSSKLGKFSKRELIDYIIEVCYEDPDSIGLDWENKEEDIAKKLEQNSTILTEITNKKIQTDKNKPTNIIIEGDNLPALSVLNYTHNELVDLIYIDPPYNLGKDFRFNDKLVDKNDEFPHSKWLSYMEKRLELAKNLLSESGVIFISLDDKEQAVCKLLCDMIFSPDNFIGNVIWEKKHTRANDAEFISDNHDFILIYARKRSCLAWNLLERTKKADANYKNPDCDPRGKWSSGPLHAKTYDKKTDYTITTPGGRKVNPPPGTSWRFSKTKLKELIKDNRIYFGKTGTNVPRVKRFPVDLKRDGMVPKTIWTKEEVGHNQEGKDQFKAILPGQAFDNPKPTRLLERIIELGTNEDSIILDFFAGTGTTGQAVLELNKKDGGNRKFILCTNNEKKIATKLCYPRIKKVIKGYTITTQQTKQGNTVTKKKTIKGTTGNLRYFKTGFVDAKDKNNQGNIKKLAEASDEILCLTEDCFDLEAKKKDFRAFSNTNGKIMCIIDHYPGIKPCIDFINKIKSKISKDQKINVYEFSLVNTTSQDDFDKAGLGEDLVNLIPYPDGIRRTYDRCNSI